MKYSIIKNAIFSLILFICLYRVAFLNPNFLPVILFGIFGILYFFREYEFDKKYIEKKFSRLFFIFSVMIFYCVCLDLRFLGRGDIYTINNLFTVRLVSLIIMSYFAAYFFNYIAKKNNGINLKLGLTIAIFIQLLFFVVLFLQPNLKPQIYDIFGMENSPNLLGNNFEERGFGIGSELNFTAPITTIIISIFIMNKNYIKFSIFVMQAANSTLSVISALILIKTKKSLFASIIISPIIYWLFLVNYYEQGIALYLPRLAREIDSGFTLTLNILINDHFLYFSENFWQFVFGNGINLLPMQGVNLVSSDIGWIILINYGGIFIICLYLIFIFEILRISPFAFYAKISMFFIILALNTKGLFLGPNALLFFIFLSIFDEMGKNQLNVGGSTSKPGRPPLASGSFRSV